MTTAPDLPTPGQLAPGLIPAPTPAPRRSLAVVPDPGLAGDDVIEFDEALRRAAPRLQAYAVRRLRDPHEAEEVVQEALLRAFQHRDKLATEDDLMAWVTVVTGRLVIDRLRVRGRTTPVAEVAPGRKAGRDTADLVVAREEARIALDALEALPGRQASVLWAREIEGLSYDEIGERFAMTEPTVRSVLHRARKALRREYALRGGTMPAVGLAALAPWLHPLRKAGLVRAVARRGAAAATVAAGGLAVVTVAPFSAPGSPVMHAPATTPAIGVTAVNHTSAMHHARGRAEVSSHLAAAPAAATAPAATHVTPTSRVMPLAPHVCSGGYTVGCTTHKAHMLFVKLPVPVAGKRWIGVSTDTVDCTALPSTTVAQCDAHEGTTS